MPNLSASQIAAQAAMHVQNGQHNRKRSTTIPDPRSVQSTNTRRQPNSPPPPLPSAKSTPADAVRSTQFNTAGTGGGRFATAGANAAFPRSPASPIDAVSSMPPPPPPPPPPLPQKEAKGKEKSKIKLFSKPKNIGISKEKDDRRPPALPSPGKSLFGSNLNQSTTSLADSTFSGATSLYSSANASTSTLVPLDKTPTNEKEKHRHHFLSRPKHKKDDFGLTLSSAASNSRPTEPNAPQLYNFAPSSPGPGSTFAKSVSGFDLRHGGRALREKKKEEKAAATTANTNLGPGYRPRDQSLNYDASEWPMVSGPDSAGASSFGPPSGGPSVFSLPSDPSVFNAGLASFGLSGMTSDDAWPLLKARLLNIFEGEDLRTPIEDFNQLVIAHMRRCIQRRTPVVLIEDLRELLQTGFSSLDQTLRKVPDDRLVPHITDMWLNVFTNILPFIQAVFLPLDLEFKGRGSIMTVREAAEFWGVSLPTNDDSNDNIPTLGEELDVRRFVLLTFRDTVILPRHDALLTIFSRLSLDSINPTADPSTSQSTSTITAIPSSSSHDPTARPGTAASLDAGLSSFNSQGSTLLDYSYSSGPSGSGTGSLGARSRATSNTSAGSFSARSLHSPIPTHPHHRHSGSQPTIHTITPLGAPTSTTATFAPSSVSTAAAGARPMGAMAPAQLKPVAAAVVSQPGSGAPTPLLPQSGAQVTETVARMLQCVAVLSSVHSGDDGQNKTERLGRELKYNWLGRGRTGRQRRGFVGARGAGRQGVGVAVGAG
ncbi:MAG: hypothetical protein Q9165_006447 [Trypethelium subeluteriae]